MARTYELALVFEPRMSENDVAETVAKYKEMIEADHTALITKEESWGKRKLAYPIQKYTEGRYLFLYVQSKSGYDWSGLERLIMQNEKVLRHLVVRTDLDLKRAESKGKVKPGEDPDEAKDNKKTDDDGKDDDKSDESSS